MYFFFNQSIYLGNVTSLEINHKNIDKATKGQEVCIKIENVPGETPKLYGRHFDHTDLLVSRVSTSVKELVLLPGSLILCANITKSSRIT